MEEEIQAKPCWESIPDEDVDWVPNTSSQGGTNCEDSVANSPPISSRSGWFYILHIEISNSIHKLQYVDLLHYSYRVDIALTATKIKSIKNFR
jgi:hypothetical protein